MVVYTFMHEWGADMEPLRVGIREFRENLASFLLESSSPVAITRHGDTIGYFIPARRSRSKPDWRALEEAAGKLAVMLADKGISEDEILQDFKRLRSARRK